MNETLAASRAGRDGETSVPAPVPRHGPSIESRPLIRGDNVAQASGTHVLVLGDQIDGVLELLEGDQLFVLELRF